MPEAALRLPVAAAADAPRAVLDVARSVTGRPWHERLDAQTRLVATAIAQAHGVPDALSRVLAARGVALDEAPGFLAPKLRDLMPDPSTLVDMDAATERLARAVLRGERVAVFGDYDVDGACSAALAARFLRALGLRVDIHIPDRITEGYGPNVGAIRALAEAGATLLVCVDCGTASHEPFAEAARLGMDVVVLDHHQAPEQLPAVAALVNPNRQDDLSGLGHLCAAGVVFLALVALARRLRGEPALARRLPDLMGELDIVALATIADVVPLVGLNRAFVRQGLAVMRGRGRPGLAALLDAAGLTAAPEAWHLGYLVGPRINAGGRVGDASLGARLLTEDDPHEAARMAEALDRHNRERQAIEALALEEAVAQAERSLGAAPDAPVLVVAGADWHPGIVGLVAARLKERFRRPAFAFGAPSPEGLATGSGRSVPGADIGRAVRAAVEAGLAAKGGGHAMAAGATVPLDGLARFGSFVAERLADPVAASLASDALPIDARLTAGGATTDLFDALEQAGPFGSGCPEPVFAFGAHRVTRALVVGTGHVKATLSAGDGRTVEGIAFRCAQEPLGRALLAAEGRPLHVAGSLTRNAWGGRTRIEVRISDVAEPTSSG
ncbi:single-stranded-DNA-specific exonuclease RecJ [Salinarimonas ramus]|uniref:Single-stranded-DNA-specific exonuclease RecJ n=1 Tax=Salinarimonas ramus TaxID=690164 RepID=A0A917Q955_9HYPH|nr:single-stranded-DNA-specific exonuclease RecJ [Salinarimonas ramus]GGK35690.1 single-stranded-DNA-specific exonuclease [Salinarimonas ramus]